MFPDKRSGKTSRRSHSNCEYLKCSVEAQIEVAVVCEECEEALDVHRNINDDEKITLLVTPCRCQHGEVPFDALSLALHCLTLMTPYEAGENNTILASGGFDIRTITAETRVRYIKQIQGYLDEVAE